MRRRDYERLERVDQKEKRSSKKKRGLKRKASGDSGPSSEEPTTDGVDGGLKEEEEEEEVDKNGLPAKVCISIIRLAYTQHYASVIQSLILLS